MSAPKLCPVTLRWVASAVRESSVMLEKTAASFKRKSSLADHMAVAASDRVTVADWIAAEAERIEAERAKGGGDVHS